MGWRLRRTKEVTMAVQVDETALERAELVEYLANVCAFARRQQHITARFTTDEPTAWDKAHRLMDGPLDDLMAMRAPAWLDRAR